MLYTYLSRYFGVEIVNWGEVIVYSEIFLRYDKTNLDFQVVPITNKIESTLLSNCRKLIILHPDSLPVGEFNFDESHLYLEISSG